MCSTGGVLEELASAIERLTLPVSGDGLLLALGLRERLDARIAAAVGEFDAAGLWDLDVV